jgi:hypothetical protein
MNNFDTREVTRQINALSAKGEYRAALNLLDGLIADQTDDPKLRVCALAPIGAIIARTIGDHGLAIRYCEMQLKFEPGNALALYAMAECLHAQGRADEAVSYAALSQEANRGRSGGDADALLELVQKKFPQLKDK